jgi:nickel-dependent lactate racemase
MSSIVITSNGGYPMDQNLYQMVKCMYTASKCCYPNGVIIAVGECRDGIGGEDFYNDFTGYDSIEDLLTCFLARDKLQTQKDQWQSQILAKILLNHSVILVSSIRKDIVKRMKIEPATDLNEALSLAYEIIGETNSPITIIPDGIGILIK